MKKLTAVTLFLLLAMYAAAAFHSSEAALRYAEEYQASHGNTDTKPDAYTTRIRAAFELDNPQN